MGEQLVYRFQHWQFNKVDGKDSATMLIKSKLAVTTKTDIPRLVSIAISIYLKHSNFTWHHTQHTTLALLVLNLMLNFEC